MADQSRVGVRIRAGLVPLLPGAREHARGASFGGLERNRAHFLEGGRVRFDGVDDDLRTLLLDPQTSGGLLVGVPAAHADAWDRARAAHGVTAVRIGDVTEGQGVIATA
jgi:selenide,water dikinase